MEYESAIVESEITKLIDVVSHILHENKNKIEKANEILSTVDVDVVNNVVMLKLQLANNKKTIEKMLAHTKFGYETLDTIRRQHGIGIV